MNTNTPADLYTPADLNELEEASGTTLLYLLENMPNNLEEQVEELLKPLGISPEDIFIDKGLARGETLATALESFADHSFMKDQGF